MNSSIQVSIICNTYNQESYIRDALEGFVRQKTDFAFEVLIHDDASPDKTADIIREYEKRYPDLIKPIYQTVNQQSQHIPYTKIYQYPRISGKYVAFCEGDDYWTDPLKLQKQFDFMEAHPDYTLCACSTTYLNLKNNRVENQFQIDSDRDIPVEDVIRETNGRIFPTVSAFFRTDALLNRPDWMNTFPVGDIAMFINAGRQGKIRMLADNMCVYRWFAKGSWTVSMNRNLQKQSDFFEKMIAGFEQFDEATDHRYADAVADRINQHRLKYAILRGNLSDVRSNNLYKSKSFPRKVQIVLQCKTPGFYRFISAILNNNLVYRLRGKYHKIN